MNATRILYRTRQFFEGLHAVPTSEEISDARFWLTPRQMALFSRLHSSEQAHSLQVMEVLRRQGEEDAGLMVAALLHDVGKCRFPLRPLERVFIVLGNAVFPRLIKKWGEGNPTGWQRPFVVAIQHPFWGADMAAEAGASPLSVSLIRRHQEKMESREIRSREDQLLFLLQNADTKN